MQLQMDPIWIFLMVYCRNSVSGDRLLFHPEQWCPLFCITNKITGVLTICNVISVTTSTAYSIAWGTPADSFTVTGHAKVSASPIPLHKYKAVRANIA